MSDEKLRALERRWKETGATVDRKAYSVALKRLGRPALPRECIRHYVDVEHHGCCGSDGLIGLKISTSGDWSYHASKIKAACSVELWPRDELFVARGYPSTMRKTIFYTEDKSEVTCKTCLKSINKPDGRVRRRTHYAPGGMLDIERGERVIPVCGRDDSAKFHETFHWRLTIPITCPACRRIMQKGQRLARRPRV